MAYEVFDQELPDPLTEAGTLAFDSSRKNLLAVRDAIIATGFFPGWDVEMQDSDGSPTTTPDQPDQLVASKGVERIRLVFTWGTVGGEDGNITVIVAEYSSNSGVLYEPMGSTGYPNGMMSISYDADGYYLSHTWS
ncbi:MAG: hypothetical protein KUF79_17400 [Candidatus Thiodiazotropha sp. (ex Ctena orbiculata)]|nr:hypothetical protein [Candidatus Thiodiazotropha taylori]